MLKAVRRGGTDVALLLTRIVVGVLLILHGWRRWQVEGIDAQIAFLTATGTPAPMVLAWGATILEMVAGMFLVFGLATPPIGLLILVEQILIIVWTKWFRGPFGGIDQAGTFFQGWSENALLGCLALLLMFLGGGRLSMDQLFKRQRRAPADNDDLTYAAPDRDFDDADPV
ncbi:DoxX family protein [Granulicoccus phenolivorans]|uniref:DoxX family protein n=1 Tax=Granulicoccus phenolivorans TaxID=266854 RepID=UPI0004020F73|nr:DoxX family protein [Granulicoccus phenolivorans]